MESLISVNYRWSVEDVIESYRYHFRHICRPLIRICLHFIFALMAVGGVLALLNYYSILNYVRIRKTHP